MAKKGKTRKRLKGYNLDMAVEAIKVLVEETHSFADCDQFVWRPTQNLLDSLAKQNPEKISCFHGRPYSLEGQPGMCSRLFIIIGNKALYLCTVIDKRQAEYIFQWFKRYQPSLAKVLGMRGTFSIIRERIRCSVPVRCQELDKGAIEQGLKRYMEVFCPQLASAQVKWLKEWEQAKLEMLIVKRAKQEAKFQTPEERKRILEQDQE